MIMNDEEIINDFTNSRNLSSKTIIGYRNTIKIYTQFNQLTLKELLTEAELEEETGIRWKKRKLKKRLMDFRVFLQRKYLIGTAKIHFQRMTAIYRHYEIEIHDLPYTSNKNVNEPIPITYKDLPDKKIIKKALKISSPVMRAVILFMSGSGCAKNETLNLTIQDFINATNEYHDKNNIYEVINALKNREDIIPTFTIKRKKTNKYYSTFCTPEATNEIINYLISSNRKLKPETPLFKIEDSYLIEKFQTMNDQLNLGKKGVYNRFRSHMLRKFHASQLYNAGLNIDQIDALQGRSKNKTRTSYFMENPEELKKKYIEHMNCLTINLDVNNLDFKSPEYVKLENENKEKDAIIKEQEARNMLFDERLKNLENTANWNLKDLKKKFG